MREDRSIFFERMSKPNLSRHNHSWLNQLKDRLDEAVGPNRNLYKELAEILGLSQESIYRRFRGDSAFTLGEIRAIGQHYPIDLTFLFAPHEVGHIGFSTFYTGPFNLDRFLSEVFSSISEVQDLRNTRLYCLAADIPIFRLLQYPSIAQFKAIYWSTLNTLEEASMPFQFDPNVVVPMAEEMTQAYHRLNVHEVWSVNTLRSTLSQIEYYVDNALVPNQNDVFLLYRDVKSLVADLFREGEEGAVLYKYGLALHNNAFLVDGEEVEELTFVVNSMNSLITKDKQMIEDFKSWLRMVLSRSIRLDAQSRKQKTFWLTELMWQIKVSYRDRLSETYQEMLE